MPELKLEDTIAALSTPPGEGGIAVIRVSGKDAIPLTAHFFRPSKKRNLKAARTHTIHHGYFRDPEGNLVDEVMVSVFRAPRSYTGEDVVEISCHGGIFITRKILELLASRSARHAEPGEFTKRAFLNGKIDLTQAEAVLDLIRARSDVSLKTALHQLQGALSRKMQDLKEALLKICAHLEASLDFPDEHLETDPGKKILKRIHGIEDEIHSLIQSFKRGAMLREGILTVIVGRPNVGKSSLLNALLGRDRALISPLPGTTRDVIEETVAIGGLAIRLVDTAGLGGSPRDELDRMGMDRTRRYFKEGDFFLFVVDGSSEWTEEDEAILHELKEKKFLPVVNKADLPQTLDLKRLNHSFSEESPCLISCTQERGLLELEKRIEKKVQDLGIFQESLTLTRLRHKQALERTLESLVRSRKTLQAKESAELILMDLRAALDSVREFVGEIYSEDFLDVIFREFCIGK